MRMPSVLEITNPVHLCIIIVLLGYGITVLTLDRLGLCPKWIKNL